MRNRTLMIGWDAADWKVILPLVEAGKMPALSRFLNEGTMADLATLEPVLSPLLWNSIATGKRADAHGILGFTEVSPATGLVRPVTSTSRTAKALWNILSQEGYAANVVGWFGSHPAEPIRGACVSDAFSRVAERAEGLLPGTVHPERLIADLTECLVRPSEIDGNLIRNFVPLVEQIDPAKPNLIPQLVRTLAESFSVHTAATHLMATEPWDFMAAYYIGVDHFSHAFMNFHPPKPDWIPEEQFDLYGEVVAGGYRLMDLLLARLLELAGPDTNVVLLSDHGFHSDHLRPRTIPGVPAGPCEQHRKLGILAMRGPDIRRDERIYGVNLLDIAPTVLAMFGLPAGEDMPGRVLAEAFVTPPDLRRIPSWETVEGESGMHRSEMPEADEGSDLLTEQFVALGYIKDPKLDRTQAALECERERAWNLSRVYMSSWRFAEALPLLERIHDEAPERGDFALSLADCQRRLGLLEEAAATAEAAIAQNAETPGGQFVLGNIALEQGRVRDALRYFHEADTAGSDIPELPSRTGVAYLKLRRWVDARRAFGRALTLDPHNALAYQGLGVALLHQGKCEEGTQALLTSIGYRHDAPQAHYYLGVCLTRMGQRERALQAFRTSLSFHPPLRAAHRWIAAFSGDAEEAESHRAAARAALSLRAENEKRLEATRQEARHRAIDRALAKNAVSSPVVSGLTITLVSGLPRSGTSLMMQMLSAAGVAIMTDGERKADESNPEGYFEWEEIRELPRKPEILLKVGDRVVKIIAALLPSLPAGNRYRVIFMDRPVREIAASQLKMLERRGTATEADQARIVSALARHRESMLERLKASPQFEVLIVDYPDLVRNPGAWVDRIAGFLGNVPEPSRISAVIKPSLYRNRT